MSTYLSSDTKITTLPFDNLGFLSLTGVGDSPITGVDPTPTSPPGGDRNEIRMSVAPNPFGPGALFALIDTY